MASRSERAGALRQFAGQLRVFQDETLIGLQRLRLDLVYADIDEEDRSTFSPEFESAAGVLTETLGLTFEAQRDRLEALAQALDALGSDGWSSREPGISPAAPFGSANAGPIDLVSATTAPVSGPTGALSAGAVTPARAADIFEHMSKQDDIAFRSPAEGCFARAHIMLKRMPSDVASGKVWTFPESLDDPLWVATPNFAGGKVEWSYHVAPVIGVCGQDGVTQDMVIDPSIFDHPVTVAEWKDSQHDKPSVVKTKLGEAPIPSRGGTGYWPGADPDEGPDLHAEETMKRFKRHQGTSGIR